ncbi:DUF4219 domain-containing protein/UBN2 domain-containing protein [Cephalotus follicularis]|uniref:DUF4219 domain-containing protein/UBN2 domain-containing protein n=1 Tax=Cephalotus follicularis TaxID=3775 RepID=A0A1Q3CRC7_CEPFO|nr:DUF4219 domain-containing protein/UBN2 domain-containing protein [Cephalotus follicularis]
MASSTSANAIPVFSGENFDFWSIKIKTILRAYDLWEVVENGIPKAAAPLKEKTKAAESTTTTTTKSESSPTTVPMKEWQKKDADALAKIHLAVSDSIFPRFMNSTSAKEAWDTLQDEFKGTVKIRAVKLQTPRRDFENLRMTERETIKDFSSREIEIVNQMKSYGGNITNQRVIEKFLISLTEKFDSVVNIIEETRNLSELSVTELVSSLQVHEQRISRRTEVFIEGAFQSKHKNKFQPKCGKSQRRQGNSKEGENKGKFPPCGICQKSSHQEKDCWQKGKPRCKNCKKFGHTDQTCRLKQQQQTGVSETQEAENQIFYACHSATAKKDDVWLIDSGCTNHMAKNPTFFTQIDTTIKVPVENVWQPLTNNFVCRKYKLSNENKQSHNNTQSNNSK